MSVSRFSVSEDEVAEHRRKNSPAGIIEVERDLGVTAQAFIDSLQYSIPRERKNIIVAITKYYY